MCPTTRRQPTGHGQERGRIRIATYNIRSGQNGRLEMALRAMRLMNVDWGFLTEAKLTSGIYTRQAQDYQVEATEATSQHSGGIALFWQRSDHWHMEAVRKHGHNVMSAVFVTGHVRYGIIGAYIPPDDISGVNFIAQANKALPQGLPLLLLGDLNADLASPRDARSQEIAAEMAAHGLEDILLHFRQRRRYCHGLTWRQEQSDRGWVRSCNDYILRAG
jgi:hypothetical protein